MRQQPYLPLVPCLMNGTPPYGPVGTTKFMFFIFFFNFLKIKSYIFNFLSYLTIQFITSRKLILVLFEKLKYLTSQKIFFKTL